MYADAALQPDRQVEFPHQTLEQDECRLTTDTSAAFTAFRDQALGAGADRLASFSGGSDLYPDAARTPTVDVFGGRQDHGFDLGGKESWIEMLAGRDQDSK